MTDLSSEAGRDRSAGGVVTVAPILLALLATDAAIVGGGAGGTPPLPRRGALPAAAAVVPGVLLHGSGHFAGGDRPTAWRLLRVEGLGLGLMLAGVGGLALTGASQRTVEPFIWTAAAGGGLLASSWAADLYGVLAPPGGTGDPQRVVPGLEARFGTRYVSDPTLAGDALVGLALDLRRGRWRFSPGAWVATDVGSNTRFEGELAFRFVGPRAGAGAAEAADGSFFDLVAGGIHHRYSEEMSGPLRAAFDMTTFELRADGRYDLQRYARSLTGSFVEGSAGVGIGAYHYPAAGTSEANTLLLARFGFGIYLGRRADRWGELRAYYDHRHDDYAGGLKMPGLGSGPLGHFGVDGRAFVTPHWGFRAEVQAGSAWVAGLALVYRYGRVAL
jgi:hypothetical protein